MDPEKNNPQQSQVPVQPETPQLLLPDKAPKDPNGEPRKENFFREIVKFVVVALIIIIPIRTFVADPFIVSGDSMDFTFANGQYLIVDQLSYHFENPQRGDVIIFRYPLDTSLFFIKRVIGLPGETVVLNQGVVTIYNAQHPLGGPGLTLKEPYVSAQNRAYNETSTTTLGSDQYYVMGDNRVESSDSHVWGPVARNLIIGRPILRLLPLSTLSVFPGRDTDLGN